MADGIKVPILSDPTQVEYQAWRGQIQAMMESIRDYRPLFDWAFAQDPAQAVVFQNNAAGQRMEDKADLLYGNVYACRFRR